MPLVSDFDPGDKEKAVSVRLFESTRCSRLCDLKSIGRHRRTCSNRVVIL